MEVQSDQNQTLIIQESIQNDSLEQKKEQTSQFSKWEKAKLKIRAISSFMSILPSKKKAEQVIAPLPKVVLAREKDPEEQSITVVQEPFTIQQSPVVDIIVEQNEQQPEIEVSEKQPLIIEPAESINNDNIEKIQGSPNMIDVSAEQSKEEIEEVETKKKKKPQKKRAAPAKKTISKSPKIDGGSLFSQSIGTTSGGGLFAMPAPQFSQFGSFGGNGFLFSQSYSSFGGYSPYQRPPEDPEKKAQREAEDSLFVPFQIKVDQDSKIESNSSETVGKETQGMRVSLSEEEQVIRIDFHGREYSIDLRNPGVQENPKLLRIVNEITHLIELNQSKQSNDSFPELRKLTAFNSLTAVEYYLMKALHEMSNSRGKWQEEICCICQCDLFENIDNYTHEQFLEQIKTQSDDDPVNLDQCEAHFFHRCCIKSMLTDSFIKCPVCTKIYGVMIGDQPPGTMHVSLDQYTRCDGHPDSSTIVIEMRMLATQSKNGSYVPPTSRVGYLPNTQEARRVLDMMKLAFQRKLLFTIGRSVTTGQDNRIIWNGVHFKTNTCGGSSNFGYPDPTYLQRVTQELSLKGIYPSQQ